MRIGIYGGSFNPPHIGHLTLAQEFLQEVDEVWIMPSDNPLKTYEVDFWDRFTMCNLALSNVPYVDRIYVSAFERALNNEHDTYSVLSKLKQYYPQHEFCFLMGSDQLRIWDQWTHQEELTNNFQIYIYSRFDDEEEKKLKEKFSNFKWINNLIISASSTEIRADLKMDRIPNWICPETINYINQKHLYHG